MSEERSRLSRKLLGKFLSRYTVIALIISVLVLAVSVFAYSEYIARTAADRMSRAADALSDYQTDLQEDSLLLLSDSSLAESVRSYYNEKDPGTLSGINLRLRAIKNSDSDLLFVMMDDLNGNLFWSLESGAEEIVQALREQEAYERLTEVNSSEFSPVFQTEAAPDGTLQEAALSFPASTDCFCIYYTRYEIGGRSFLATFVYDAAQVVDAARQASTPLDGFSLYSNRNVLLYSGGSGTEHVPGDMDASVNSRGKLTKDGYFYLHNNYSVYAVGCVTVRTFLGRLFLLFTVLLAIYLIPVLLSLFSLYPAAEKLLHPIYDLNRQVRKFSIGKPPVDVIETGDEIENLSASIRNMSADINQQALEISEKEREKALTYYKLLTTQLDPHFIYNTMNIINILARRQQYEDIILVNTALTRVLRERLNTQNTTFSPVCEEIETLKQYLLIMDYRYHHQVLVDFNVDEGAMDMLLPKNILQPIVENSYYHGLTREDGEIRGSISLFIYPDDEELVLEISDDGEGISADRLAFLKSHDYSLNGPESKRSHIGIENIYRRLQYLYDSSFTLDIQSTEGSGTTVVITIPVMKELPAARQTDAAAPDRQDPDSPT